MVITMTKLRMAHASMHGARKPPGLIWVSEVIQNMATSFVSHGGLLVQSVVFESFNLSLFCWYFRPAQLPHSISKKVGFDLKHLSRAVYLKQHQKKFWIFGAARFHFIKEIPKIYKRKYASGAMDWEWWLVGSEISLILSSMLLISRQTLDNGSGCHRQFITALS